MVVWCELRGSLPVFRSRKRTEEGDRQSSDSCSPFLRSLTDGVVRKVEVSPSTPLEFLWLD